MKDSVYWIACENARDDAHTNGIHRTQAEVEADAKRYRNMDQKN